MDFLHRGDSDLRRGQKSEMELTRQSFASRSAPEPQRLHGTSPDADHVLQRENSPLYARTDPGVTSDKLTDPKSKTKLELLKDQFDGEEDPSRKLQAWKHYYLELINTKTSSMKENPFKKEIKNTIKNSEKSEAQDEVERLQKKKDLSLEDIKDLENRKQLELDIEINNHVNLREDISHADPKNAKSGRWSIEQLQKMQRTLATLPENDVKNNHRLLEFVRSGDINKGSDKNAAAHYDPNENSVVLFDKINKTSEKEGFERDVAHEVGHSVHSRLSETKEGRNIIDRYNAIIGWKQFSSKDALIANMSGGKGDDENAQAAVKRLEAVREEGFQIREKSKNQVNINGQRYMVDPLHSGQYYSAPTENLPETDAFDYGRTDPGEHFAESYAFNFFQKDSLSSCKTLAEKRKFESENWKDLTNEEKQEKIKQSKRLHRQQEIIDKQQEIMTKEIIGKQNFINKADHPFSHYTA